MVSRPRRLCGTPVTATAATGEPLKAFRALRRTVDRQGPERRIVRALGVSARRAAKSGQSSVVSRQLKLTTEG